MPHRLDGYVDSSGECTDICAQLGIYLFGAITPADRVTVVRHLATCPPCRDELAGLAALPGLLIRPPVAAAAFDDDDPAAEPQKAPGPTLLHRTIDAITRRLTCRGGRSGCRRCR
jgi:anti-sigma factor RsiW